MSLVGIGSALLTQLAVNGCVMMRRLSIGIKYTDAGLEEKTAQDSVVARFLGCPQQIRRAILLAR